MPCCCPWYNCTYVLGKTVYSVVGSSEESDHGWTDDANNKTAMVVML